MDIKPMPTRLQAIPSWQLRLQTDGFQIFGLKSSNQCFCGNIDGRYSGPAMAESECDQPCSGDSREFCGGAERYSVYRTEKEVNITSKHVGCYIDGMNRVLSVMKDGSVASVQECCQFCYDNGYRVFGTEYGGECFCGDSGYDKHESADETECSMKCADGLPCGGPWRISIYLLTEDESLKPVYQGCYADSAEKNSCTLLAGLATATLCANICHQAGFQIFGLKSSNQCFCGNINGRYSGSATVDSECDQPCSGDSGEFCGGAETYSVYRTEKEVRIVSKHVGCFIDGVDRVLGGMKDYSVASVQECRQFCYDNGYRVFGTEYGAECFCGDSGYDRHEAVDETECSMKCADGLPCGGPWRISIYLITEVLDNYGKSFSRTDHTKRYEVTREIISTSPGLCALDCLSNNGCVGYSYVGGSCFQFQPNCSSLSNHTFPIYISKELGVKHIDNDILLTTSSGKETTIQGSLLPSMFFEQSNSHWLAIDMNSIYSVCGLWVQTFGIIDEDLTRLSVLFAYHPDLLPNGPTCYENSSLADYIPCNADARCLKIEFILMRYKQLTVEDIYVEGWKRENI
ncbi:uncharacterized protein [Watersipora subatra]|uniref:uncharacterized protein n=1 Tax=Watersipora subatra TaxID=2589382 RepID=UPI00355C7BC5